MLRIEDYSEKSFAVYGETKNVKDKLKELGGKFNMNLKEGPGWIFSNKNREKVEEYINKKDIKKIYEENGNSEISTVFISILVNLEDTEIIGCYSNMTQAVRETFKFLCNGEYLDIEEIEEYLDKDIDTEDFLEILKKETNNWKYSKVHEVCRKYNSGYDMKNMFVKISEKIFHK